MGPQISFGTHFWKFILGDVLKVRHCIPLMGLSLIWAKFLVSSLKNQI
jgi:hypothetical protein